jgi:hypothetical protein
MPIGELILPDGSLWRVVVVDDAGVIRKYDMVTLADPEGNVLGEPPGTPADTNVDVSISPVTILAANPARSQASVFNDSAATLYLKLGTGVSATSFTVKMAPGSLYELPQPAVGKPYQGIITGVWSAAGAGAARVTELT